jgi:hypothetical protein
VPTFINRSEKNEIGSCPQCSAILNAATPLECCKGEQSPPRPGDITVCVYCSTLLKIGEGNQYLRVTEEERASFPKGLLAAIDLALENPEDEGRYIMKNPPKRN